MLLFTFNLDILRIKRYVIAMVYILNDQTNISHNRWFRLAKQIPWEGIEKLWSSSFSGTGSGCA
jgi:hypothetical protein